MSVLAPAAPPGFQWAFTNQVGPSTTPGTSVVPGASNAEGAWTQIATAAQITEDVYGIIFWITGGGTSTTSKNHLLDIGYDPAGGTSYTERVPNLGCGESGTAIQGGVSFYVPIFIPAGSSIAVRIQGNASTAGTVRVMATLLGRPVSPEFAQKLTAAETIGTISASCGPSVTPGTSAAEGAWTLIGATTFPWRHILPLLQMNDTSTASQVVFLDVAHGDASNKTILAEGIAYYLPGSSEQICGGPVDNVHDLWCNIPAGVNIYVRISQSASTAETYNVLVTGFG